MDRRVMDAASIWFQRELHRRVQAGIDAGDAALANGNAFSFDDYRYRVGFQRALRQVLEISEEISKDYGKARNS
jgi:hypothetical protein